MYNNINLQIDILQIFYYLLHLKNIVNPHCVHVVLIYDYDMGFYILMCIYSHVYYSL